MRLGVIGYTAKTGIGVMTEELCKQLPIKAQLVVPHDTAEQLVPTVSRNMAYSKTWTPDDNSINIFSNLVDVAITVETDWGGQTFKKLKDRGVKIVKIPMYEWWEPTATSNTFVDLWICTTKQCFNGLPYKNKVYLPWPVDLSAIPFWVRKGKATTFLHNAGNIGINGRKGTYEVIKAFSEIDNPDINLIINSQRQLPWTHALDLIHRDSRIGYKVHNADHFGDLYKEGDVFIYVSKYDGQSLIGEEACAAGMPVITTNAPPMNEHWSVGDYNHNLLVNVARRIPAQTLNPTSRMNLIDLEDLKDKILWCTNNDMSIISVQNREIAEAEFDWKIWANLYYDALENLCTTDTP
jgi:glycosyltransferase involved in cell wall biosynthesis